MERANRGLNCLVIGKAKTGTTALAHLLKEEIGASLVQMEPKGIVEILGSVPPEPGFVTKIIFEHFRNRYRHLSAIIHNELYVRYDRVIFIRRDLRDEMISRLLYLAKVMPDGRHSRESWEQWVTILQQKERDPGSIGFRDICLAFESIFGLDAWKDITETHTTTEIEYRDFLATQINRNRHVIAYEDMVEGRLSGLSAYLGFEFTKTSAEVNLGEFAYTKRSASHGAWRSFFTQQDVEVIRDLFDSKNINTFRDWSLAQAPTLNPAEYSQYVYRIRSEFNDFRTEAKAHGA